MASTQIRNIINNKIDKVIAQAKSEVKKEGRKETTKIKENLPTPEDLKSKILTPACTSKAQDTIGKIFNNNKKLLDKFKNIIEKAREKMSSLQNKLENISTFIDTIKTILTALAGILLALEIVVRVAPAGLAASSGPVANGLVIDRLGKAIDYGKAKIKEYGSLTQAILAALPKYLEKALKVLALVGAAILALNLIITLINKLSAFLEFIYAKYIESCTASLVPSKLILYVITIKILCPSSVWDTFTFIKDICGIYLFIWLFIFSFNESRSILFSKSCLLKPTPKSGWFTLSPASVNKTFIKLAFTWSLRVSVPFLIFSSSKGKATPILTFLLRSNGLILLFEFIIGIYYLSIGLFLFIAFIKLL